MDTVSENSTECSVSKERNQRFSLARNAGDNRPAFSIKGVTDIRDREIPELEMLLQDAQDKLTKAQTANDQAAIRANTAKIGKLGEALEGWQGILDYIEDVAGKAQRKELAPVSGLMPSTLVDDMVDRIWGKDLEQAQKDVAEASAAVDDAQTRYWVCIFLFFTDCRGAQNELTIANTKLALAKNKENNVTTQMERARESTTETNTISFTGE